MLKSFIVVFVVFISGLGFWLNFGPSNNSMDGAYNSVEPTNEILPTKITTVETEVIGLEVVTDRLDKTQVKTQSIIKKDEVENTGDQPLKPPVDIDEKKRRKGVFASFLYNYAGFTTDDYFRLFENSGFSVHLEMLNNLIICQNVTPGCENDLTSVAKNAVAHTEEPPSKVICSSEICYLEGPVPYISDLRRDIKFKDFIKPSELISRDPNINYTLKTNRSRDRFVTIIETCPDSLCWSLRNN